MALRWYTGHLPVVVNNNLPAIQYGESFDFPDSRLASLSADEWKSENPFATEPPVEKTKAVVKDTTPITEPATEPEDEEE